MRKQWKTRENTSNIQKQSRFLDWIVDKDKRSTAAWLGSAVGIAFILGYYISLGDGFTPNVKIGEASIVLFKAALLGTVLFAAFCVGVFSPAWAFRMADIDIDNLRGTSRRPVISSLLRRSIAAQVLGASLTSCLYLVCTSDTGDSNWQALFFACLALGACATILRSRQLKEFGFPESRSTFWQSIFWLTTTSFFSLLIFVIIISVNHKMPPMLDSIVAWGALAVISGILGTIRRTDLVPSSFSALFFFIFILQYLQVFNWPFQAVAYMVGIAEPKPVTLVLPSDICPQLQRAFRGTRELECEGENSGVLTQVLLQNSWGERWLVRASVDSEGITFNGSNVVIRKDKSRVKKPVP
ncbi:hypothetical protein [Duganella sp. S19_KUP01_CR8]|uniref:hypothetical protein n=1 Tax=Duganella sp. S19_KUP01_CR8 TaxID=3025502 RepID=UPI002FCD849E